MTADITTSRATTLRDQFAMSALAGMLAGDPNYPPTWEEAAAAAYLAADAMLAARTPQRRTTQRD
ncbi:MAG: hypothetical protein IPN92_10090 [Chromatiaceae bacterium]|nr:hypothetical protein [Chromatiaceae bacterium]